MNVLEKKYPQKNISNAVEILKFGLNKPELVGTGSLSSQYYPADYDFLCKIKTKYDNEKSYKLFKNIIDNFSQSNNLFFIEFKIQRNSENKAKIYDPSEFTKEYFDANFDDKIELCKLDGIILLDGLLKEISCIYFFKSEPLDREKYIKTLLDDQVSYYDDKKYYKSLKRLMLATKYKNPIDFKLINVITNLFNSSVGALYMLKNEIDACLIFAKKYNETPRGNKIVKMFIKNIGLGNLDVKKLESLSSEYGKLIDREALKYAKEHKLPVGELAKFNTIK